MTDVNKAARLLAANLIRAGACDDATVQILHDSGWSPAQIAATQSKIYAWAEMLGIAEWDETTWRRWKREQKEVP